MRTRRNEVGYELAEEFSFFLLTLLLWRPREHHMLADICTLFADRYAPISISSAENIVKRLKDAGIPIRGVRGPGGGYKPGEGLGVVTLLGVKQALGFAPTNPASAWARRQNSLLDRVTLTELLAEF